MIKCKTCQIVTDTVFVTGPILFAEGLITFDNDSRKVLAVGPLTAVQTVRAGEELSSAQLSWRCTACGFVGGQNDFQFVARCVLSGVGTTNSVQTDLGEFPCIPELAEEARRIFSMANAAWQVDLELV